MAYKTSRTAIVTRKGCEMRRYRGWHQGGMGLVPAHQPLELSRGQIFHSIAQHLVLGESWLDKLDTWMELIEPNIRDAQKVLIRRAMLGWDLVRGKWYREHFDIMSTEQEWSWKLGPQVDIDFRLDRVLRRKVDKLVGIMDFKTMKEPDANWIERQLNDDQTHLYVQGLKEQSGEFVLGIAYEGIILGGYVKDGTPNTPFVMGYETKDGKIQPQWKAGLSRVDLTKYTDEAWVKWITQSGMLNELYTTTGFLNPIPSQLLHTKDASAVAELKWFGRMEQLEAVKSTYGEDSEEFQNEFRTIEKNSGQCLKYGWGKVCPYYDQCWHGMEVDEDEFKPRVDHHGEVDTV